MVRPELHPHLSPLQRPSPLYPVLYISSLTLLCQAPYRFTSPPDQSILYFMMAMDQRPDHTDGKSLERDSSMFSFSEQSRILSRDLWADSNIKKPSTSNRFRNSLQRICGKDQVTFRLYTRCADQRKSQQDLPPSQPLLPHNIPRLPRPYRAESESLPRAPPSHQIREKLRRSIPPLFTGPISSRPTFDPKISIPSHMADDGRGSPLSSLHLKVSFASLKEHPWQGPCY